MKPRDVKFIMRALVMFMVALVAALGARIALESNEIAKIASPGVLRDTLMIFAPMTSLAILQFSLALRSYGMRSLGSELLLYTSVAAAYLAICLPFYFGSTSNLPATNCSWWKVFGCSTSTFRPNYLVLALILLAGVGSMSLLLKREQLLPARRN